MANYQLAISNIAWHKEDDEAVYTAMQQAGFTGLEIAPTRIFPEMPYENLTSALLFGGYLKNQWPRGTACAWPSRLIPRCIPTT